MDKVPQSTFFILFLIGALAGRCCSLRCEVPGKFADVTNCRSFISCEMGADGILLAYVLSCNTSEVFNPSLSECVPSDNYICLQDDTLNNIETNSSESRERKFLEDFICIWPGIKFPDYSSMNCSDYFTCVYRNGSIRKVSQSCPTNQIFDIEKNTCIDSSLSKCRRTDWGEPDKIMYKYMDAVHNINITVTTIKNLTNCRDSGRFFNSEEPDCRNYTSCERGANGSFTKQYGMCTDQYIFDPFLSICVEERYFQCQVKTISHANLHEYYGSYAEYMKWRSLTHKCGRRQRCTNVGIYPDYSIPGCRGFQLCLNTNEFAYKSISQICPQDYVFNPAKSMCTINESISCPCNMQYDSENTTIEIDHHQTSPSPEVTAEANLLPSNNNTNTSTPETNDCPKTIERCTREGLFPNFNEQGCKRFILCVKSNDTSFVMLNVHCPVNYAFDANDSQCKPNNRYKCPCQSKSFPINETTVKPDNYTTTGSMSTTAFDNYTSTSTAEYESILTTAGYESTSVTKKTCYKSFYDTLCTRTGFMPDYSVTNCSGYKLCLISENGSFSEYKFICPNNSVFHLSHNMCLPSETFDCACEKYTIANDEVASAAATGDHLHTHENVVNQKSCPIYDCLSTGLLPEHLIPDCRGYKSCVKFDTKILTAIRYICPFRTVFDTNTSTCVESNSVNCPCTNTFEKVPVLNVTASLNETTLPLNQTSEQVSSNTSSVSGIIVESTTPLLEVTTLAVKDTTKPTITIPYDVTSENGLNVNTTSNNITESHVTESTSVNACPVRECPASGRHPDYTVSNCRGYKLCLRAQNNTFNEIKLVCPQARIFDVSKSICVEPQNYVCPCNNIFETTLITTATTTHLDINLPTISTESSVVSETSSSSNITESHVTESTSVNTCLVHECPASGRHPDHTVSNCRGYKLCLRAQNNTFNEIKLVCPQARIFDVSKSICVEPQNYVCPCNNIFETTLITTATTTHLDINLPTISTESSVVSETSSSSNITESHVTESTSVNTCLVHECPASGRHPDYTVSNCRGYKLCLKAQNNTFNEIKLECPHPRIFDVSKSICVEPQNYVCPCNNVVETTMFTTVTLSTESSVVSETSTATNTSSTALSNNVSTLSTVSTETSTHSGITDTQVTIVECPVSIKTCAAVGRYPDYSANDCSKFILCVLLNDGTYSKLNMTCPGINLFDTNLSLCVQPTTFECPCVASVKIESSNITETDTNIFSPGIIAATEVNIAHTETPLVNTEAIASVSTESYNTDNLNVCPEYITSCPATGNYPDYSSNDCRQFFQCAPVNNGTISMLRKTCPVDQLFNVNTSKCVEFTSYQCPCVVSSTNGSNNSQNVSNNNGTGDIVEPNITTTLSLDVTTQSSIPGSNVSTLNSTNKVDVVTSTSLPLDVCPEVACSQVGRLADYSVSGCRGYKLCISSNTGFKVLKLLCPLPNVYDPLKSICVEPQKYQCICA